MKKNIQKTIVAGTATLFGGIALAGAVAPANAAPSVNWDAVAECESGGDWGINTGNGFSGGLQFTQQTWAGHGGSGSAANASKAEQIRVAENVMETQGIGAWPTCGPKGLGGASSTAPAPEPAPAQTEVSTQSVEPAAEPAPAPVAEKAAPEQAPVVEQAPIEAPAPVEAPAAEQAPVVEYTTPAAPVAPQAAVSGTYEVQAGDTLATIAAEHGTDWETLFAANGDTVADANMIFVGQSLNIPA